MEEEKLPVGFAMALAMNEQAMKAFARLPEEARTAVLREARSLRSKRALHRLALSLLEGREGPLSSPDAV